MAAHSDISQRTVIELSPATSEICRRFINSVIQGYKRARLQALVHFFAPLFGRYTVKFPANTPANAADSVLKLLTGQTPPSLELTRHACALLYANPENVRRAFEALPTAYRIIFDTLFGNVYISGDMIRRTIENNLDKYSRPLRDGSGREAFVSADAISVVLQRVNGFTHTECYTMEFGMLRYIGEILGAGIFARSTPRATATLPDEPLTVHECADDFIACIPQIYETMVNDRIHPSQTNGVIKASDLKMFSALSRLPEFFPDSPTRQVRDLRMRDTVTIFNNALRRLLTRYEADDVEKARLCNDLRYADNFMLAALSLPYFINLRKAYFERADYRLVTRNLSKALQDFGLDADGNALWLDADDLATYIFNNLPPARRLMANPPEYGLTRTMVNAVTGEGITDSSIVRHLSLPAIKGLMLVMCSTGGADIAVAPAAKDGPSPFDALRYIKLSDFGRFCAGLTDTYTPVRKDAEPTAAVELDPDRLIITALTEDVRPLVKSRFGESIGAGRFLVTEKSFFRQVTDGASLDAKIEVLRTLAAIDRFPPLWDEFFRRFSQRFTAILGKALDRWFLFEIVDPSCPGLVDMLTSDPDIRPLIRLVEGNAFMVKRTDMPNLNRELQKRGYPKLYPLDTYYYDIY